MPEELKNSTKAIPSGVEAPTGAVTYNITCSNNNYYTNYITYYEENEETWKEGNWFAIYYYNGNILFGLTDSNKNSITDENYEQYKDLAFTISMAEPIGTQTGLTLNPFTIGTLMTACTEVTGTDGKTYYDISIDDFNELISNDTIGQQNILELEDFILTGIESSAGSSIGLDPDLYSAYGEMRPITYNTDPYVYLPFDCVSFAIWTWHVKNFHGSNTSIISNVDDSAWKFYKDNASNFDEDSDFGIVMYVYENKNSTSEEDKYFIRFGIGTQGSGELDNLYNKEYIENNYPNVWNAEINILSWKKVKEFEEQHQNCQSQNN